MRQGLEEAGEELLQERVTGTASTKAQRQEQRFVCL